jgi:hypothetical protein
MLGNGVRNDLEWIQISLLQRRHAVFPTGPGFDRASLISTISGNFANLLLERYKCAARDTKKCPPKLYFHFP